MKKIILLSFVLASPLVMAESIELSTGEVVDGKLVEFPKEVTIELTDGSKMKIPYEGINSIYKVTAPRSYTPFLTKDKEKDGKKDKGLDKAVDNSFEDMDASKGPYATPTLTFQTWKKAAMNDDIDGMANCYSSSKKNSVKKDLKKISKKTREEMRSAMTQTIFTPNEPYYQGEFAIMEVSWTKGLASQNQTLKFTLENNKEWKIAE